jgi:hypothetical protein
MAVPGEQESFKSQSFSSPKKTTGASSPFASGQSGAAGSQAAKREVARAQYFDNRSDITADRLDRRIKQAEEYEKFKADPTKTKLVGGTTNLYQAATPGGITLAEKQMQLANKYGPTFSEIMSDVTYASGKVLGALGERAMSGSLGIFGALKDVANYAFNKANQGYDKLNSVDQLIFDEGEEKYPFAHKKFAIEAVNNSRLLALEATRDANSFAADATAGILGVDQNRLDGFVNEPMDTFSGATMGPKVDMRRPTEEELASMDIGYVESGQLKEDLQKSGILTVDDPSTQEPFSDSTKIPGQNATLGDLRNALKNQGLDDLQIQSAINEIGQQIISGQYTGDFEVDTGSTATDDQVSFTPYNNPFNLEFRGQEGAEPGYGGKEGTRFASFDTLDKGITAGIDRVAEIVGEGKSTDDFLNVYAPRSDNPESYDNYLATLQDKVGETIEPNEIKSLTEGIVKFENKPELADQYLNYLEQQKDKLYSGIVS